MVACCCFASTSAASNHYCAAGLDDRSIKFGMGHYHLPKVLQKDGNEREIGLIVKKLKCKTVGE